MADEHKQALERWRVEGDLSDANYWYCRVGQAVPDSELDEEFKRLYQMAAN